MGKPILPVDISFQSFNPWDDSPPQSIRINQDEFRLDFDGKASNLAIKPDKDQTYDISILVDRNWTHLDTVKLVPGDRVVIEKVFDQFYLVFLEETSSIGDFHDGPFVPETPPNISPP